MFCLAIHQLTPQHYHRRMLPTQRTNTMVSGRCASDSNPLQAKMFIRYIEVDTTGRSGCALCLKAIDIGSLRLVVKDRRFDSRVHLDCWKADPIIEPTIFNGYQNLSEANKAKVVEYCNRINGSVLRKRKAEDPLPETRAVKRICLESVRDESVWAYEGERCPIKSVPNELVHDIFDMLDYKSLDSLSLTCKKLFVLATDDALWQPKVEQKYSHLLHLKVDESQTWISFYKLMHENTCVHCLKPTPHHFPPVNGKLCETCRGLKEYFTIPKAWAKSKYHLTDTDMKKANMQFFKSNTSNNYLLSDVRALAKKLNKPPPSKSPQDQIGRKKFKPGDEEYEDFRPDPK